MKQKAVAISFQDLADWLIKECGLPDDTEICTVQHANNATFFTVIVRSDTFQPVPTKFHAHNLVRPQVAIKEWLAEERHW